MTPQLKTNSRSEQLKLALTALGLSGLVAGCNGTNPLVPQANAQEPATATPTFTPSPTPAPPIATSTPTSSPTPSPTFTPWPTFTPIPTATPWARPAGWQPNPLPLPVLEPLPVVPTRSAAAPAGLLPVSYSPPDGVDVFGGTILRWEYFGELAEDEWFDIKIRPYGSNDSVFVDWSKSKEYALGPWPGWTAGLYTWQIGIVKGTKAGETKQFEADLGRDSQPFVIKWQTAGSGGGGGGGSASGGGGGSSSGGGGGGTSGGS